MNEIRIHHDIGRCHKHIRRHLDLILIQPPQEINHKTRKNLEIGLIPGRKTQPGQRKQHCQYHYQYIGTVPSLPCRFLFDQLFKKQIYPQQNQAVIQNLELIKHINDLFQK